MVENSQVKLFPKFPNLTYCLVQNNICLFSDFWDALYVIYYLTYITYAFISLLLNVDTYLPFFIISSFIDWQHTCISNLILNEMYASR